MELIAAVTAGALSAVGVWMLLDRSLVRVVLGVAVLGNAINLGVFTAGRLGSDAAPFVGGSAPGILANPLPQALVLTAIVIGFGLFAFALAVLWRTWVAHRSIATDRITRRAEEPAPDLPRPSPERESEPR